MFETVLNMTPWTVVFMFQFLLFTYSNCDVPENSTVRLFAKAPNFQCLVPHHENRILCSGQDVTGKLFDENGTTPVSENDVSQIKSLTCSERVCCFVRMSKKSASCWGDFSKYIPGGEVPYDWLGFDGRYKDFMYDDFFFHIPESNFQEKISYYQELDSLMHNNDILVCTAVQISKKGYSDRKSAITFPYGDAYMVDRDRVQLRNHNGVEDLILSLYNVLDSLNTWDIEILSYQNRFLYYLPRERWQFLKATTARLVENTVVGRQHYCLHFNFIGMEDIVCYGNNDHNQMGVDNTKYFTKIRSPKGSNREYIPVPIQSYLPDYGKEVNDKLAPSVNLWSGMSADFTVFGNFFMGYYFFGKGQSLGKQIYLEKADSYPLKACLTRDSVCYIDDNYSPRCYNIDTDQTFIYDTGIAVSIFCGTYGSCILNKNDQVECWGQETYDQFLQPFVQTANIIQSQSEVSVISLNETVTIQLENLLNQVPSNVNSILYQVFEQDKTINLELATKNLQEEKRRIRKANNNNLQEWQNAYVKFSINIIQNIVDIDLNVSSSIEPQYINDPCTTFFYFDLDTDVNVEFGVKFKLPMCGTGEYFGHNRQLLQLQKQKYYRIESMNKSIVSNCPCFENLNNETLVSCVITQKGYYMLIQTEESECFPSDEYDICEMCLPGTYKDWDGDESCLSCPYGHTSEYGAENISQCFPISHVVVDDFFTETFDFNSSIPHNISNFILRYDYAEEKLEPLELESRNVNTIDYSFFNTTDLFQIHLAPLCNISIDTVLINNTVKQVCLPGNFLNGSDCILCEQNFYCHSSKKYSCPNNYTSEVGSSTIKQCYVSNGYYLTDDNVTAICPSNFYCINGDRFPCHNNKTSPIGSHKLDDCTCTISGYYSDYNNDCKICLENSYCFNSKIYSCPEHTTSPKGSKSIQDCECVPGFYGSTCTICGFNGFCPGKGVKKLCPQGSFTLNNASTNITECVCNSGFYGAFGNNTLRCVQCPENTYCPVGTIEQPYTCPLNTESPIQTKDISGCVCQDGYFRNTTTNICTICPAGFYCTREILIECPVPQNYSFKNSSKLQDCFCAPGFIKNDWDCILCPLNHFCPGFDEQISCPTFSSGTKRGLITISQCICDDGHEMIDGRCEVCPEHSFSRGSNVCTCLPGYYLNSTANCTKCPVNTICTGNNNFISCPENSTSNEGSSDDESCLCIPGTFLNLTSRTCQICPENHFCQNSEKNLCLINSKPSVDKAVCECLDGSFQPDPTKNVCEACQHGGYCIDSIQFDCPLGQMTHYNGNLNSVDSQEDCKCSPGGYIDLNGDCVPCRDTEYCPDGNLSVSCDIDGGVSFLPRKGPSDCACPSGSDLLIDKCVPCPIGSYCYEGTTEECPLEHTSNFNSTDITDCFCISPVHVSDGTNCILRNDTSSCLVFAVSEYPMSTNVILITKDLHSIVAESDSQRTIQNVVSRQESQSILYILNLIGWSYHLDPLQMDDTSEYVSVIENEHTNSRSIVRDYNFTVQDGQQSNENEFLNLNVEPHTILLEGGSVWTFSEWEDTYLFQHETIYGLFDHSISAPFKVGSKLVVFRPDIQTVEMFQIHKNETYYQRSLLRCNISPLVQESTVKKLSLINFKVFVLTDFLYVVDLHTCKVSLPVDDTDGYKSMSVVTIQDELRLILFGHKTRQAVILVEICGICHSSNVDCFECTEEGQFLSEDCKALQVLEKVESESSKFINRTDLIILPPSSTTTSENIVTSSTSEISTTSVEDTLVETTPEPNVTNATSLEPTTTPPPTTTLPVETTETPIPLLASYRKSYEMVFDRNDQYLSLAEKISLISSVGGISICCFLIVIKKAVSRRKFNPSL